jgi:hypothetical protein
METVGKQNTSNQGYISIIVEKGVIIRDYKGLERLRIIKQGSRINLQ